ncbi:Clavaminate synthase-like protein [Myriangium duriaei CBS 260.36]|uniref:Clavaminate synthase-like protein n=1 Tax=Myriangium duriaei CBS 260.36 TaxID=1168546 RepID=A0A9P4J0S3_9PEZI|nr:Clavaminate synthase-like protein [Myriangium duriaei CBS 260.36]
MALDSGIEIYLAQASLSDLPEALRDDVPTPELVLKAGKGDIYDTSIWLGRAPTYTPLHKDPNPNLFVQLAGTKKVRMFGPQIGAAIFAHVQRSIGGNASAALRGEEMMQGKEREVLEEAVWNVTDQQPWMSDALECEVSAGDALFIPKGWWHSIKGIGSGMTGSVNWWFR